MFPILPISYAMRTAALPVGSLPRWGTVSPAPRSCFPCVKSGFSGNSVKQAENCQKFNVSLGARFPILVTRHIKSERQTGTSPSPMK